MFGSPPILRMRSGSWSGSWLKFFRRPTDWLVQVSAVDRTNFAVSRSPFEMGSNAHCAGSDASARESANRSFSLAASSSKVQRTSRLWVSRVVESVSLVEPCRHDRKECAAAQISDQPIGVIAADRGPEITCIGIVSAEALGAFVAERVEIGIRRIRALDVALETGA